VLPLGRPTLAGVTSRGNPGYTSNRFAHKYGLRLRPKLVADRGPYQTRAEAEAAEAALAERLRRRGYAVWSN
jgi:hypothetical protein